MDFEEDFQIVHFTTFKPISVNKEQSKRNTSRSQIIHPEETNAKVQVEDKNMESKSFLTSSNNGTHKKEISKKCTGSLKEQTQQWFERSQRRRLVKNGEFPDWFHGFVTRKRSEEMLQDKPLGCFLIRFCESRVGFVLSYRGTERCRHFMLDQLENSRYVVEGEQSTHLQLQDLLDYYQSVPLDPYKEVLTTACVKKHINHNSIAHLQSHVEATKKEQMYSRISREANMPEDKAPLVATSPQERKNFLSEENMEVEYASTSLQAKSQDVHRKNSTKHLKHKSEKAVYAPVQKNSASSTQSKAKTYSPEDKYATMEALHSYTEPPRWRNEEKYTFSEVHEPINFYAMGRGCSKNSQDNVYSEVDANSMTSHGFKKDMHKQAAHASLPHATDKALNNKASTFHLSFRMHKQSTSSSEEQGRDWGITSKAFSNTKASKPLQNLKMHCDDSVNANSTLHGRIPNPTPNPVEDMEAIYEKIPEDCAFNQKNIWSAKHKTKS